MGRVEIIPDFLRKASAALSCKNLTVIVPPDLEIEGKAAITAFGRDILQLENEFQTSNGRFKKMRLLPGSYDVSLSSFVSGSLLGQQEMKITQSERELPISLTFKP